MCHRNHTALKQHDSFAKFFLFLLLDLNHDLN